MSQDFSEMLETATPTDEVMDVDMPFLDAYRRGGSTELQRVQAQDADISQAEAQAQIAEAQAHVPLEEGRERGPRRPADGSRPEYDSGEGKVEPSEPNHELVPGDGEPLGETNLRGGTGGTSSSGGAAGGVLPGEPTTGTANVTAPARDTETDTAVDGVGNVIASAGLNLETERETPTSLQLTDHQEAVQGAVSTRGGSDGVADAAPLPQSGFRLAGVKSQPHIKSLPDSIVSVLREQLRSAAVRELGVSDAAAREFSRRLGQGTLVTAFLLAQLDLRIDADAATQRAAELFRSRDPLLGSVAARLESLEQLEQEKGDTLRRLLHELAEVRQTSAVIEQAVAYSIADGTENFLRGSHDIRDAPITHKDALFVRDRAREATRLQAKLERERDGRPIR